MRMKVVTICYTCRLIQCRRRRRRRRRRGGVRGGVTACILFCFTAHWKYILIHRTKILDRGNYNKSVPFSYFLREYHFIASKILTMQTVDYNI